MRVAQVMTALGTLVNTVHTSIYLDLRSTSSWACSAMFLPLVWSLSSLPVHGLGIIAMDLRKGKCMLQSDISGLKQSLDEDDGAIGETLNWLASLGSLMHMVFGVFVYSSLIFVSTFDGLPIFFRYAASAIICQVIFSQRSLRDARIRLDIERVSGAPKRVSISQSSSLLELTQSADSKGS